MWKERLKYYQDPSDEQSVRVPFEWLVGSLDWAQSAEEFYDMLACCIRMAHLLKETEIMDLARIASTPWKRTPGAPRQRRRQLLVLLKYADRPGMTRIQRIEAIGADFKITPEAARKLYEKARREGMSGITGKKPT